MLQGSQNRWVDLSKNAQQFIGCVILCLSVVVANMPVYQLETFAEAAGDSLNRRQKVDTARLVQLQPVAKSEEAAEDGYTICAWSAGKVRDSDDHGLTKSVNADIRAGRLQNVIDWHFHSNMALPLGVRYVFQY